MITQVHLSSNPTKGNLQGVKLKVDVRPVDVEGLPRGSPSTGASLYPEPGVLCKSLDSYSQSMTDNLAI